MWDKFLISVHVEHPISLRVYWVLSIFVEDQLVACEFISEFSILFHYLIFIYHCGCFYASTMLVFSPQSEVSFETWWSDSFRVFVCLSCFVVLFGGGLFKRSLIIQCLLWLCKNIRIRFLFLWKIFGFNYCIKFVGFFWIMYFNNTIVLIFEKTLFSNLFLSI